MRTRAQLNNLTTHIGILYRHGKSPEAVALLDSLHSEGMTDAIEIAKSTWMNSEIDIGQDAVFHETKKAILAARDNKPKL